MVHGSDHRWRAHHEPANTCLGKRHAAGTWDVWALSLRGFFLRRSGYPSNGFRA